MGFDTGIQQKEGFRLTRLLGTHTTFAAEDLAELAVRRRAEELPAAEAWRGLANGHSVYICIYTYIYM